MRRKTEGKLKLTISCKGKKPEIVYADTQDEAIRGFIQAISRLLNRDPIQLLREISKS